MAAFKLTWRELQIKLREITKAEQAEKLLNAAIAAGVSPQFVLRIQGRLSKLRRYAEQRDAVRRMK
jgi:hypothetical protein